jgi:predicted transcriptional regulator
MPMYTNLSFGIAFRSILASGFKYRDRARIVKDILDSINSDSKGKTKTSIMRGANLNVDQVNTYLEFLMIEGLIKPADPVKSQEIGRYRLTQKGFIYAREIENWSYLLAAHSSRPR